MRHTVTILLAAVAIVLGVAASGHAQEMSDRRGGDSSHHDGGGHHHGSGDHIGHQGHRGFRGPFVYWNPDPVYVQPTPGYWYYCPSAQAYYPYVTYCLDSWVPVRAQ